MKCCNINAGMLRTPVEFQRSTRTSDGAGGATTAWTAITGTPTRAHVVDVSGYERMQAMRLDGQTVARLVVRYVDGITPKDRVLIEGEIFGISFINDVERRKRWLEIDLRGGVVT